MRSVSVMDLVVIEATGGHLGDEVRYVNKFGLLTSKAEAGALYERTWAERDVELNKSLGATVSFRLVTVRELLEQGLL